jgi:hypothetical protein
MKLRSLAIIIALAVSLMSGCFGGLGNINRTARPALTKQYLEYLNDSDERRRVDNEWLDSVDIFKKAGWERPAHPWGDRSLASMGIAKAKSHQYSKQ